MRRRSRSTSSVPAIRPMRAPAELTEGVGAAILAHIDRMTAADPSDDRKVKP